MPERLQVSKENQIDAEVSKPEARKKHEELFAEIGDAKNRKLLLDYTKRVLEHSVEDGIKLINRLNLTGPEVAQIITTPSFALKHNDLLRLVLVKPQMINEAYSAIRKNPEQAKILLKMINLWDNHYLPAREWKEYDEFVKLLEKERAESVVDKVTADIDAYYAPLLKTRKFAPAKQQSKEYPRGEQTMGLRGETRQLKSSEELADETLGQYELLLRPAYYVWTANETLKKYLTDHKLAGEPKLAEGNYFASDHSGFFTVKEEIQSECDRLHIPFAEIEAKLNSAKYTSITANIRSAEAERGIAKKLNKTLEDSGQKVELVGERYEVIDEKKKEEEKVESDGWDSKEREFAEWVDEERWIFLLNGREFQICFSETTNRYQVYLVAGSKRYPVSNRFKALVRIIVIKRFGNKLEITGCENNNPDCPHETQEAILDIDEIRKLEAAEKDKKNNEWSEVKEFELSLIDTRDKDEISRLLVRSGAEKRIKINGRVFGLYKINNKYIICKPMFDASIAPVSPAYEEFGRLPGSFDIKNGKVLMHLPGSVTTLDLYLDKMRKLEVAEKEKQDNIIVGKQIHPNISTVGQQFIKYNFEFPNKAINIVKKFLFMGEGIRQFIEIDGEQIGPTWDPMFEINRVEYDKKNESFSIFGYGDKEDFDRKDETKLEIIISHKLAKEIEGSKTEEKSKEIKADFLGKCRYQLGGVKIKIIPHGFEDQLIDDETGTIVSEVFPQFSQVEEILYEAGVISIIGQVADGKTLTKLARSLPVQNKILVRKIEGIGEFAEEKAEKKSRRVDAKFIPGEKSIGRDLYDFKGVRVGFVDMKGMVKSGGYEGLFDLDNGGRIISGGFVPFREFTEFYYEDGVFHMSGIDETGKQATVVLKVRDSEFIKKMEGQELELKQFDLSKFTDFKEARYIPKLGWRFRAKAGRDRNFKYYDEHGTEHTLTLPWKDGFAYLLGEDTLMDNLGNIIAEYKPLENIKSIGDHIYFNTMIGGKWVLANEEGVVLQSTTDMMASSDGVNHEGRMYFIASSPMRNKLFVVDENGNLVGPEYNSLVQLHDLRSIDGKLMVGVKDKMNNEDRTFLVAGQEVDNTINPLNGININGVLYYVERNDEINGEYVVGKDNTDLKGVPVFNLILNLDRNGDDLMIFGYLTARDFDDQKATSVRIKLEKPVVEEKKARELTVEEQKQLQLLNLLHRPTLNGVYDHFGGIKSEIEAQITKKKGLKSLVTGSPMISSILSKVIGSEPELFLDTVAAKRNRGLEDVFAEQLALKIFPEIRLARAQKAWNGFSGFSGLESGKGGKGKADPADYLRANSQYDVVGGGADSLGDEREIMEMRDMVGGMVVTGIYGRYDGNQKKWGRLDFVVDSPLIEPIVETTASISGIGSLSEVMLPKPLEARVIPERIKGFDSSGKEYELSIEINNLGEVTVVKKPKAVEKIAYSISVSTAPAPMEALPQSDYNSYKQKFEVVNGREMTAQLAGLAEDLELELLDLIKGKTPKEQVVAIERFVRDAGYYDYSNQEVSQLKAGKSLEEQMYIMEQRLEELRQKNPNSSQYKNKRFAGVCADFAQVTAVLLRRAGFASGIISGFGGNDKKIKVKHAHATAFVVWPDENGHNRVISIDGTPDGVEGISLPSLVEQENEAIKRDKESAKLPTEEIQRIIDTLNSADPETVLKMSNGELERTLNNILKYQVKESQFAIIEKLFDFYWYAQSEQSKRPIAKLDLANPYQHAEAMLELSGAVSRQRKRLAENPNNDETPAGNKLMEMMQNFLARFIAIGVSEDKYAAITLMEKIIELVQNDLTDIEKKSAYAVIAYLKAKNILGDKK